MKPILVSLVALTLSLCCAWSQTSPASAITYEDVLGALKFGATESTVLGKFAESPTTFVLDERQIAELKAAGASDRLISAMTQPPSPPATGTAPGDSATPSDSGGTDIIIILDCSGSMVDKTPEGISKMDAAKRAVLELISLIPDGRRLGLIVYGRSEERECDAVDLIRPLAELDVEGRLQLSQIIGSLEPVGHTPLAKSLHLAGETLPGGTGLTKIVLITDGMETCQGDPAMEASQLAGKLRIADGLTVIGFGVKPEEQLAIQAIAEAGGGTYKAADSADNLVRRTALIGASLARPAQVPKGISTAKGLEVVRWVTYRPVTAFHKDLRPGFLDLALSGDGSRIALATDPGLWLVNADGSGGQSLSEKRVGHGGADISADGNTVLWHDADGVFLYDVPSSTRFKLPTVGIATWSLKLSGDGRWILLWDYSTGNLFRLPRDGSDIRKVVTNTGPAQLSGHPENRNLWGMGVADGPDLNHDGSIIAFSYGGEAFVANSDGSGLRMLTKNKGFTDKKYMNKVRISADGTRITYYYPSIQTFVVSDVAGRILAEHPGIAHVDRAELTADGRWVGVGRGWRMLSAYGSQRLDLTHVGHNYPRAVAGASMTSISYDGSRAAMLVTGNYGDQKGYQQVLVAELYSPDLTGYPPLNNINVVPRFLANDGAIRATLTVECLSDSVDAVQAFLMKDGAVGATSQYGAAAALDDGSRHGDTTAKDLIYTCDQLSIRPPNPESAVPPGPINLRVYAVDQLGRMILADLAGLESRAP